MPVTVVCGESALAQLKSQLGEAADVTAVGGSLPGSPWVLWLDGLSDAELASLEKALPTSNPRLIAVLGARWDGFTPLPLVALCRGVISGLGVAGVVAAIATMARETGS